MIEIKGCGTALVTPFLASGGLDLDSYRKLVRWQVDSGIDFLVPCGTTGESVTLSEIEYGKVIRSCVETVEGVLPVVAGAGTNSTDHAIQLARLAEKEGADAILSVTPYYNKPTAEGIFRHFRSISDSVKIPIIMYNVPGRTGTNILPKTIFRLSGIQNIIGLKEASGDLVQMMELLAHRPAGFSILSGDDNFCLALTCLGGQGVISVASNLIPAEMSRLIELVDSGDLEGACQIHYRYLDLMNLNFIESNPIPVKYALSKMGKINEVYRLPMCPMERLNKDRMDEELEKLNLLISSTSARDID